MKIHKWTRPRIVRPVTAMLLASALVLMPAGSAQAAELNTGDILVTDTSPDALFHFDPATGTKTPVSVGGLGGAIAVGLDGRIYAADNSTKELIRVDPMTGDQTVVAGEFDWLADIAVAHGGDILVVVDRGPQIGLIRVDKDTGATSEAWNFNSVFDPSPRAVTVEADGDIIVGAMSGVTVYLFRIDPATGEDELIFSDVCPQFSDRLCIDNLWNIAAGPNGDIALLDPTGGVFLWDAETGDLIYLGGVFGGNMQGLAVESDGHVLFGYFGFGDLSGHSGLYRMEPREAEFAGGDRTKIADFERAVGVAVVPDIDRRAPSVFIGLPADDAAYRKDEVVFANYVCHDGGSGIHSCIGTVENGAPIDTSAAARGKSFTVAATDNAGNTTTLTHHYLVDGTTPTITIATPPEGAVYQQDDIVFADYSCADTGSGIATCTSEAPGEFDTVNTSTPGPHTFTVTAADRAGNTATLTHDYAVVGNDPPIASDLSVATLEDEPVALSLSASDPDGDSLTYSITSPPANGSLSGTAPDLTYSPGINFNGADGLTYTAEDGAGASDEATVAFEVTPVNDAPSFTSGPDISVLEDSGAYSADWASNISPGPGDEAGQALAFHLTDNTNPGLFDGTPGLASNGGLSFTPAPNAHGRASLSVVLSDDGGTSNGGRDTSQVATVTITVSAVNDPPIAGDDHTSTPADTALHLTSSALTGNDADVDGDTLEVTAVQATSATHGTVSLSSGTVTYSPDVGYSGPASFTYTVSDGHGESDVANVDVDVVPLTPPSGSFNCDGTYGPGTTKNVTVPKDGRCNFNGTTITGNVQVLKGSFGMRDTSIEGNFEAINPGWIDLDGGTIGGNVRIKRATSTPTNEAMNLICGLTIGGNLQLEENLAPFAIGHSPCGSGNSIGGNVKVEKSQVAGPVSVVISYNTIGGNLECKVNSPPVSGVPFSNSAKKKEGECAGL